MLVEDRGGPGQDGFAFAGAPGGVDGSICPSPQSQATVPLTPFVEGDIAVHDAVPLPTSKDLCKNGGWRNLGQTFKNQGQCMSFVATGGKKQP